MTEKVISPDPGIYEYLRGYIGARHGDPVNNSLKEYCDAIIQTRQFVWIGAFQVLDELHRERLHLYFMETNPPLERSHTAEENLAISRWLASKKQFERTIGHEFRLTSYTVRGDWIAPQEAAQTIASRLVERQNMLEARVLWEGNLA